MEQRSVWEQLTHKNFTLPGPPDDLLAAAESGRVLDIGCGYGRLLRTFAAHDLRAFGVDLAIGMAQRARRDGIAAPIAVMSAQQLGLAAAQFDLVTIVAVLTAVAYDGAVRATIAEAARVLRPGGTLFIADFLIDPAPDRQPRYIAGQRETGVWGMFRLDGAQGGYVRHFEPDDLRAIVEQHCYITDWQEQTGRSMNGNPARSIRIIARKTSIDSPLY